MANSSVRINGAIRASEVRVIGEDGNQLGVMSRADALLEADRAGLDLVEIFPNAKPPVVKVVDWGKYQYQQQKQQKKNRSGSKQSEVKQMRMGMKIGKGDLDIKLRKITNFLADGHKVKIQVFFRGREMAHQELGFVKINEIAEMLSDVAVVDQKPVQAGRNISIVVRSKGNAKAKDAPRDSEADQEN